MRKFVSLTIITAALLTAACGDRDPNAPRRTLVDVRYIVTEAPFMRSDDCYLRVRREDEPQTAPVRLIRNRTGNAIRVCQAHRAGDLVIRTETGMVPPPGGPEGAPKGG